MEFIYLTSEQMAKVDELAVSKYGLTVSQMMENAGRNVARWIVSELKPKKVIVLFGKGNNGGDGLCAARHLAIYGVDVEIVSAFSKVASENVEHQLKILKAMRIRPSVYFKAKECDVVIDGLLGYNIRGNPSGKFAELINAANFMRENGMKIVSYDLPSGLDPDTGEAREPCIEADYTMTLALPKEGLKKADKTKIGKLFLVNIGIPNELYKKEFGAKIGNYFRESDVVEVI